MPQVVYEKFPVLLFTLTKFLPKIQKQISNGYPYSKDLLIPSQNAENFIFSDLNRTEDRWELQRKILFPVIIICNGSQINDKKY